MFGAVGGYVYLYQPAQGHGSLNAAVAKGFVFHLFARYAPVGVKVEQHGLVRVFGKGSLNGLLQLGNALEFAAVGAVFSLRRMQGKETVQRGGLAAQAGDAEPQSAGQQNRAECGGYGFQAA